MYDLIIIGAGPAGLSAAIYAARAGLHFIVLDQNPMSGGQVLMTYEVDNYPGFPGISGMELGMKLKEHADNLSVECRTVQVLSYDFNHTVKKIETDQGETLESKAIVIAMGASHAMLGVPGEKELTGMGVSYCATCDGAFFRNRTVAVVGGGDVALEDVIFLAGLCKKVYLIHRRDRFRGAKILQDRVMEFENVEILKNHVVTEIQGESRVSGITVQNVQNIEETHLEVQGIFIAVGMKPQTNELPQELLRDENGFVIAGEDCRTNLSGIFAAGDIRTKKLRQIITAAADGANAITSVQEYLLSWEA